MIKLLLVDFDGVMSRSKFYDSYPKEYKEEFKTLLKSLFVSADVSLLDSWMRGNISYKDVHSKIANSPEIASIYDQALLQSIAAMQLNEKMLNTVQRVRDRGVKVALFTNNMDVFDNFTVDYFGLKDKFDAIYSSSQHGKLKFEDDTLLMRAAAEASASTEEIALVDDSISSIEAMEKLGGIPFLYANYLNDHPRFESWVFDLLENSAPISKVQRNTVNHKKHFTVTGYTANRSKTKMLLIYHKGLKRWLPPGGHVEINESPDATVLREIREETGLHKTVRFSYTGVDLQTKDVVDVQIPVPIAMTYQIIPSNPKDEEHIHLDMVYALEASERERLHADDMGIEQIKWVDIEDIIANRIDVFDTVKGYAKHLRKTRRTR